MFDAPPLDKYSKGGDSAPKVFIIFLNIAPQPFLSLQWYSVRLTKLRGKILLQQQESTNQSTTNSRNEASCKANPNSKCA